MKYYSTLTILITLALQMLCFASHTGFQYKLTTLCKVLDSTMELSFIADVFVNFFTTYIDPVTKEECTKSKKIRERYLKTWFVPDALR
jgi:hypothetical protein